MTRKAKEVKSTSDSEEGHVEVVLVCSSESAASAVADVASGLLPADCQCTALTTRVLISGLHTTAQVLEMNCEQSTWTDLAAAADADPTYIPEGALFLDVCRVLGCVEDVVVPHDHEERSSLFWNVFWGKSSTRGLCEYFGPQVALYFTFARHYNLFLAPMAVVGVLMYVYRYVEGKTIGASVLAPLYAGTVCLWAQLLILFWERRATALLSHVNDDPSPVRADDLDTRAEFGAGATIHQVVGDHHIATLDGMGRVAVKVAGVAVSMLWLCVACGAWVISLNVQGYLPHPSDWAHIPYFHALSESGAVFDVESWMSLVPILLHSIVILGINMVYSSIAEHMTRMENPRTHAEFRSAVVWKRFLFEAADAFIPLAYLAFVRQNVSALRVELLSLFLADELRRVVVESLIPAALVVFSGVPFFGSTHPSKKDASAAEADEHATAILSASAHLEEQGELFDDYLEMVLQFGYIILFAAAFPLAPALALLSNLVEVRSDMWKLCFVHKRELCARMLERNAAWSQIMLFMALLSVPSNLFLIAFSSHQLDALIGDITPGDDLEPEEDPTVLKLLIFAEHAALFVILLLHFAIPKKPSRPVKVVRVAKTKEE